VVRTRSSSSPTSGSGVRGGGAKKSGEAAVGDERVEHRVVEAGEPLAGRSHPRQVHGVGAGVAQGRDARLQLEQR
jgi:hypothetical protein